MSLIVCGGAGARGAQRGAVLPRGGKPRGVSNDVITERMSGAPTS